LKINNTHKNKFTKNCTDYTLAITAIIGTLYYKIKAA
jgi:hypothetical protein